jgi:hypothetical protein
MSIKKIYQIITAIAIYITLTVGFGLSSQAQSSSPAKTGTPSTNTLTTPSTTTKPVDLCTGESGFGSCLGGTSSYATGDSKDIVTSLAINLVNMLIFIGAAIAVLFIVFGGYKYITASGDDTKVKEGRSMVINALIGLAVAILSFTLVSVLSRIISTLNIGNT